MRVLSENALWDTITALGLMICFYYGVTGIATVWYFRKVAFDSIRNIAFRFVFPLVGGLTLLTMFVTTAVESIDPAYGSGSAVFATQYDADGIAQNGIGLVFVTGVGVLLLGVIVMLVVAKRNPAFFKGEVIKVEFAAKEGAVTKAPVKNDETRTSSEKQPPSV